MYRGLVEAFYTDAQGRPLRWDGGCSPIQVIGSYTRTCRCVIDPATAGGRERWDTLWREMNSYNRVSATVQV